jgi:hypothetical protein
MASSGTRAPRRWPASRRRGAAGALLGLLVLAGGCAPTSRIGSPLRTERLADLTVGVSTADQVVQALGPPQGKGMTHSSSLKEPRRILYYHYIEAAAGRTDQSILLVFLLADRYDGYMWFVAGQIVKGEVSP